MCKKNKVWLVLCVLIALALLPGCERKTYQYPFEQELSNVIKVEVYRYHYAANSADDYMTLVTELDLENAQKLLRDISALPCYKHYGDFPLGSYGEIILYITYANKESEVIGSVNTASVHPDSKWWIKGYYFDSEQWSEVLTKYVDIRLVPELDE